MAVMRDYGKIHSAIWSSPDFLGYSDDSKLLVFYMLTSTHTTLTGAFRLPNGYICADIGWTPERVDKGLAELFEKGFCNRCETTKWLWICKFLRWNAPENPNQWKAVTKQAMQIPSQCAWKLDFMRFLADLYESAYPENENPFETLSKPEAVTEAVTEAGTGTGAEGDASAADDGESKPPDPPKETEHETEFERLWLKRPRRAGNDPKQRAFNAFKARLRNGASVEDIESGMERYNRFCEATGKIGTETVMQFATFCGPDEPWSQDWRIPRQGASLSHSNDDAIARALGER